MNIYRCYQYVPCLVMVLVGARNDAAPVTFEFAGVVIQSDIGEFSISEPLTGQFTFESATADSDDDPHTGHYVPAVTDYRLLFSNGYSGTFDNAGALTDVLVIDDDPIDAFSVVAHLSGNPVEGLVPEISTANFMTNRAPGIFISSAALPLTPPDIQLADIASGSLRFTDRKFVHYDITSLTLAGPLCDFNNNLTCDLNDINLMFQQGNLVSGISVVGGNVFDLNDDLSINSADIDGWLNSAAATNGWDFPYRRGDTDDIGAIQDGGHRDVDITDFNVLSTNFNPAEGNQRAGNWDFGNFDGDGDIDITDFNYLAANFSPTNYLGSPLTPIPEPASICMVMMAASFLTFQMGLRRWGQDCV